MKRNMTTKEIEYREMRLENRIHKMEQKISDEPSVKSIIKKCQRELRLLDSMR